MKRVLHIMGGLKRGGLETFAMNIYRAVDRSEIQFDFLLTQVGNGEYEEEACLLGANVYHLPARNKGYKAYLRALDEFFSEHHDYVAIHEHISSLTSIDPAYYAMKYGIPVRIFHSHSSSIQKSLRLFWVHKLLHYINKYKVKRWATHYLGCSDKALDWMFKYTGVRDAAIKINNGIDSGLYRYDADVRAEVRKELNIHDDDFVVGHVGRFIPLKNQVFLVEVLSELQRLYPRVKLLLIGDGETVDIVKSKVVECNLEEDVIFTGVRSDVNRLFQAMDVFAMPSWFEGLPVSLVEAQAAGLPVIASDTISKDVNITNTVIFKSIDISPQEWAKTIVEMWTKLGRLDNTDTIIKAGFDSKTIVKQLLQIYLGHV